MALIIEDGTIVANANSYCTLIEIRAFALARGVTLTAVDADLEVMVTKAIDYLESLRIRYKGVLVSATQSLHWPRSLAYIDGYLNASNVIPKYLKNAQCQLVIEISNGFDVAPTVEGFKVKREKIGPIETEFLSSTGGDIPVMHAVNRYLEPLFRSRPCLLNRKA